MEDMHNVVCVWIKDADLHLAGNRFSQSAGVQLIKNSLYQNGSFIPLMPWKPLEGRDADGLIAKNVSDLSSTIGLIVLPEELIENVFSTGLSDVYTEEDFAIKLQKPSVLSAIENISCHLLKYTTTSKSDLTGGIGINAPRLLTTTRNGNGKFVGLHVDSWDKHSLIERGKSTNRIVVNLGREDRFFLFIRDTMMTVYNVVAKFSPDTPPANYTNSINTISQYFMKNPAIPVVRMRLKPGEAYIAPTENLIHDGCSQERTSSDIVLSLRGKFYFGKDVQSNFE